MAPMTSESLIPMLMLFTIGAVLLIAIFMFAKFLSKRRNRQAAEHAFKGSEAEDGRDLR
jgi:NADH:ubiquinone oxidoreductase subunit 3 (subunit A)